MPFVKVVKNKAYFKRFQTKYRRRREGKTDYYARQRLVVQAKNKYNTPRYRLVVRSSNKYITCQIVYSEIDHDNVICQASSKELARYGLTVGLKNYAGAYCTGLLVARRLLSSLGDFGLDELYPGNEETEGEVVTTEHNDKTYFVEEVDEDKKPFRVVLDLGLVATTVGNRVFGAMKGASDGGLDIPHNEKNFPGYDKETKEFDAETHKSHIFGGHVSEYMAEIKDADADEGGEMYTQLFGGYERAGVEGDDLEELYEKVHAAIRADPSPAQATSAKVRNAENTGEHNKKFRNRVKMSHSQRKDRIKQKKAFAAAQEE